jgi:branched-chain amino acid transport system permease protein
VGEFLQSFGSGLASGAVFGLLGLGLVIIYRATDVVNFAIGSMGLLGVYIAISIQESGAPFVISIILGIIAVGIIGVIVRELFIRPLGSGAMIAALAVTMGLGFAVDQLTTQIWGGVPRNLPLLIQGNQRWAGAAFTNEQILTVVVALVVMLAVAFLFRRTSLGAAMRAVAESPRTASLLGVSVQRIGRYAWFLGLALATLAAALSAPGAGVSPGGMEDALFAAVSGIFLGGLTSMVGAVVGGLAIGVLYNLVASYASANLHYTLVFGVVVVVLLLRPEGIFGARRLERV